MRGGSFRVSVLHPYSKLSGRQILGIPRGADVPVPLTRDPSEPAKTTLIRSSQVLAFDARDVIFEPNSEILSQDTRLFRQPHTRRLGRNLDPEDLYSASSQILWNSAHFCIREGGAAGPITIIPKGILLNGQSCTNWYHWIINILPKAFVVEEFVGLSPEIPYLVSQSLRGTRMEEALRLVIGKKKQVIFLEDRPYKVEQAFIIETPVREVYRPKNILSPVKWSDCGSFHFEIMARYRSHLRKNALRVSSTAASKVGNKLFLARDNVSRPYNQKEVESLLQGMGFESVSLEQKSFSDQVAIIASAKFVIGPTGAQWAAWLFSERAVGVILVPRFLKGSSLFAKLGVAGGSELFEFAMQSNELAWGQYNSTSSPSTVNNAELQAFLVKYWEANGL